MEDFLGHVFAAMMELLGVAGEGVNERKLSIAFFSILSIFCLVAGCLLTGWASAVLFGLAGLGLIALALIVCRVLN